MTSVRVLLGLGSNLGDRAAALRSGVDALSSSLGGVVTCSALYETDPVGGPEQGPFLNLVVRYDLPSCPDPWTVLAAAHGTEQAAGRVREIRWGPRSLDVDVLWIDGVTMDDPALTIPHPRMFERDFVLVPLGDVAPDLVPAGWRGGDARGIRGLGPLT